MNRTVLVALLLTPLLSASDHRREGQEIIERALSRSDIRELSSITMKANVNIANQGKLLAGQYVFLWNGPNQWREEISFPGFNEIRIGGPGTVAIKRNFDFEPQRVFQLRRVLGYGRGDLTLRPDEVIKQVRTRKVNGVEARCVEITREIGKREFCADASTGAEVRDRPFVDKDFAPVGAKIFPHFLSYVEDGKPVAEAEVTELKTTEPLPPSTFDRPAGAVSRPGCLSPATGRLIKRVEPIYPAIEEKITHVQGTVTIYAVIGADGSLHDTRIISGLSPGLNKASLDAVQQWTYEPFTCQDTPVEFETVIQVNFSLGH